MAECEEESTALVRVGARSLVKNDVIEAEIVEDPYDSEFVRRASPCNSNMFPDGPRTWKDAVKAGEQPCPHLKKCQSGFLDTHQCTMAWGSRVAQEAMKSGSLDAEV